MKNICFENIKINDGFWKVKQDMVKNSTLYAVYNRFVDTHRFDAFSCTWKEGEPDMPHIFWDSDVAKWIEGASYLLMEQRDERIEAIIDDVVDKIVSNSDENGYFNSHFLVTEKDKRFKIRDNHELYCAGHLMEAAVAYNKATGKDKFLKAMCRFADYIDKVFREEKSAEFVTPGHPEIELALVRLYDATGENGIWSCQSFSLMSMVREKMILITEWILQIFCIIKMTCLCVSVRLPRDTLCEHYIFTAVWRILPQDAMIRSCLKRASVCLRIWQIRKCISAADWAQHIWAKHLPYRIICRTERHIQKLVQLLQWHYSVNVCSSWILTRNMPMLRKE